MSFGRWLLVNSFPIFLLGLFFFGYIFKEELQLENAYQQIFQSSQETEVSLSPGLTRPQVEKPQTSDDSDQINTIINPTIDNSGQSVNETKSSLKTVPTVPAQRLDKPEPDELLATDSRLYLARQAYWDKNYSDAIYLYRQLILENSNNPDYLGELGNIYYSLNDHQNASQLYFQAAMIFIGQNLPDRARLLVAPVIAMNRELGEKLKYQLQSDIN